MKKNYSKNYSISFIKEYLLKNIAFWLLFLFGSFYGYSQSDACSGAVLLTSNTSCITTTGSTVGATDNNETGDCTNGTEKAVWYKFVAVSTAHTVTVDGATGFDAVVGANSACGSTTRPTGGACTDATFDGGIETLNLTGLTIGNTYYIQVYDYYGDETANGFTICVTHSIPITNDTCSTAISLTPNTTCTPTTGGTNGATSETETGECSFLGTAYDVWYSFVATSTNHTVTVDGITGFDAVIGAFSSCGGSHPTGGGCTDATAGGGIETMNLTGLTIGNTYYIQVYEYWDDLTANGFTICVTETPMMVPATGNNTYTTCSGTIYDNGGSTGNYASSSNGYSVITPSTAGTYAEVSGSITAEAGYDYLTIYDGVGTGGTVLWGGAPHGSGTSCTTFTVPTITSISGSLTIRFQSDGTGQCSGFALNINCSPTPGTGPPVTYCSPTSWDPDGLYINSFAFVGTLADPAVNTSTFSGTGYQDFTTLTPLAEQAQGEGVNIVAYATGTTFLRGTWKAWVDWNKDGDFTDAGEEVFNIYGFAGGSVTFGFAIPTAQAPGDYRLRIRVNNGDDGAETFGFDFDPCDDFDSGFWEDNYGETEDYLFTVVAKCNSLITSVTDGEICGTGTVDLEAEATSGVTEFRWYNALTGGSLVGTSTPSGTTTTWTTPSLATTTTYYVTAWDGTCESQVRTAVVAKISPTPSVSFTPSSPVVCGEQPVQITAGGDKETVHLINEKFNSGLGVFSTINNDANPTATDNKTRFTNQTSVYVPTTLVNVWFPAISSGFGSNSFAVASSDASAPDYPDYPVDNSLALTSSVNSTDFLNLTLKLKLYYSRYYPAGLYPTDEYVAIELSTDGGGTYPVTIATFTSNQGIGTKFVDLSYDLSTYIDETNLKIRIRQYADADASSGWTPGGVAVDNVELFGEKPLNTAFNYNTAVVQAFTDAACTTTYTSGTPVTTIWVKPTLTQLASGTTFNIPVTATLSNGCSAAGSINVTNNTKVFKAGTAGTDWNNAANWGPTGLPTATDCVIIEDNDVNVTGSSFNGLGLNLTVKPTGNLNIEAGNAVTITDFVNIESGGVLEIQDDASLVQINDVNNTGNALVHRVTTGSPQDYVYWSSPVDGFNTPASGFVYRWDPVYTNPNGSQGYWLGATNTSMVEGKGYIIRDIFSRDFSGVLRNGNVSIGIQRGSFTTAGTSSGVAYTKDDDDWNLLGNPYPSAISVSSFLAANNDPSTGIQGAVYVWRHNIGLSSANPDPFYEDFQLNYDVNSYITHNGTGSTPAGYNGFIPSGQGFFVNMVDGGAASSSVVFNNSMRNASHDNSQFYRTSSANKSMLTTEEKHRIWLEISNSNNNSVTTLIGYVENATNEYDNLYDAIPYAANTFNIYSLINNEKYLIQGRSLPFNENDQVPLGFLVPNDGIYTIGINQVDGLFETDNQDIYLEDLQLGIIHDLRVAPYSFTATSGYNGTRFVLRYTTNSLNANTFDLDNTVLVHTQNAITVTSTNEVIKSVIVHDILGKLIYQNKKVNTTELQIESIKKSNTAYIVEVELENGKSKTVKVIF
ncbi:GEVED domain-containing protein [Flavobacterium sp.]|uniref:GEVED domain-containing protein n=1 Tax=Flavobacterium sp. TaxID=239 RepID=UPI003529AF14